MTSWHSMTSGQVFEALKTSEQGLSAAEAKHRLAEYGLNEIKAQDPVTALDILIQQFKDFLILLLIGAAMISIVIGLWEHSVQEIIEAGLILLIVIFIVLVGFYQEYHAARELEALKAMLTPTAVVERGGEIMEISAGEVVPGDIIHVEAGARVAADARLLEAAQLKVNESALTGEALPAGKSVKALAEDLPLGDRVNLLFMGTAVTNGKGRAVVTATGMATEFGRIAESIQTIEEKRTPLQERLDIVGRQIGLGVIGLCAVVFVVGSWLQDLPALEMFLVSVALAVAAVPEGLPGVVTVALAVGTRRLVDHQVIVRTLPAVETLGCTTVICSDKTGTITHNQMTVKKIYLTGDSLDVEGEGYDPQGEYLRGGETVEVKKDGRLLRLLTAAGLCNNAGLRQEDGTWKVTGEPTEAGLLVAAAKGGLGLADLKSAYPRVEELAFSSERKRMATIHEDGDGFIVYAKGAPDVLLALCSRVETPSGQRGLDPEQAEEILAANARLADDAYRVLAAAYKSCPEKPGEDEAEQDLIFLGLFGIKDPPRDDAKAAIAKCRQAGVRTVMITGDHQATAVAIGREVGLCDGEPKVMVGAELARLSIEELKGRVEEVNVFARVSPEHKLNIVTALQELGHVVAMTGDGVNDAPALRKADIGVAMGITGTDVSREAADMVLTDDNFASIVGAVEEGRGIYDNIRKFFAYMISGNIIEVTLIFVTSIWAGLPIALTATQILIINLVSDGFPALALGVDPFEPGAMNRPPRPKDEPLYKGLSAYVIGYPLIMTVAALGLMLWVYDASLGNEIEVQTVAFLTVAFSENWQSFAARSVRYPSIKVGLFKNPWLIVAVAASASFCLGLVYLPLNIPYWNIPMANIVGVTPLPFRTLALVLVVSSLGYFYLEISKGLRSRRETV